MLTMSFIIILCGACLVGGYKMSNSESVSRPSLAKAAKTA
jgi:hypothetical protein